MLNMEKKERIKNILREVTEKNSFGVVVTGPNQESVVMCRIPSSNII